MPKEQTVKSEPLFPASVPSDLSTTIPETFTSPEAFDFERLRLSANNERIHEKGGLQKRIAEATSPKELILSEQSIHELKEYESSFDKTRKWKKPFGGFP